MSTDEEIKHVLKELAEGSKAGGYLLNPDDEFTMELIRGLLTNQERFGYRACPCRLASGVREEDMDIICPCDYRDADLTEHGACYCALYISKEVLERKKRLTSIPDRRPPEEKRTRFSEPSPDTIEKSLPYPVWRCKVCGYLCAREGPPLTCPICKAGKERFEKFM
jgi:ferredoxin-thioredoxin reductase catalytic subunit/rubredoxin